MARHSDDTGSMASLESQFGGINISDQDSVQQQRYFDRFDFKADQSHPLRQEFNRLAQEQGWKRNGKKYQKEFQQALKEELAYFSTLRPDNRTVLQSLCMDVGENPPPASNKACKKVLSKFFINIHDYIDCKRRGNPVSPIFRSKKAFSEYTRNNKKFFWRKFAKEDPYLKQLLEVLI